MFNALGWFNFRFRWPILGAAVGLVVLAVFWGFGLFGSLVDSGDTGDPSSDAFRANALAAEKFGDDSSSLVVLYTSDNFVVTDPEYQRAVDDDLATLPGAAVTATSTYWSTGAAEMASRDMKSTFAIVGLAGSTTEEVKSSFEAVVPALDAAPEGFTAQVGGGKAVGEATGSQVDSDMVLAESISTPILLFLLILVFGGLVAASLPLIIGGLAVLGAFTALRVVSIFTDLSIFSINVVTMLGLGLAIDYALFVVSRFREEIHVDGDVERALSVTMRTAGRTVAFSGLTVAISLGSLMIFPQLFLRSMAIGGMAAVLMAMLGSLTVLPAMLAVIGTRIDRLQVRIFPRNRARHRRPQPGTWYGIAMSVMRRPVIYVAVIVPALLVLALPFLSVTFGQPDHRVLPEGTEARVVAERLAADFAGGDRDSLFLVASFSEPVSTPATQDQIAAYQADLDAVPGVDATEVTGSADNAVRLAVEHGFDAQSDQAKVLVADIRAVQPPPGTDVLVGGTTAELVDMLASLGARLPWMALWIISATLILLFMAFGSVVLPIKAVLMNLLSLTASFGAIVWIFQDGHLSGLLNFTPTGAVDSAQPILMLAIAFGLSMDYEVFLLSRIRESWDETGDNAKAVATGLQRTGRIITSAALLLIVVFAAFATSGITLVKMVGVGMVLAILIDATVVRTFLVPATMQLLGRANWWAPAPMVRFWRKYGWRETEQVAGDAPTGSDATTDSKLRRHRQSARDQGWLTPPMLNLPRKQLQQNELGTGRHVESPAGEERTPVNSG